MRRFGSALVAMLAVGCTVTVTATKNGRDGGEVHNAMWVPPSLSGADFDLTLAPSTRQFRPGAPTNTMGFNGASYWGPTLFVKKGDDVRIRVTNRLDETTTTHWHGIHLPAVMDGGPHQPIASGATWSPSFKVKNRAATYWYHPHMHHRTQAHLALGGGGFLIVQDEKEAALPLPRTYGVDDIPIVFTSRRFDANNQIDLHAAYGDYVLANGTLFPEASLPAQVVRLRILNAEVERGYNLGFSDNRTFHVIGTDGGLLEAPVATTRLRMAPGERYEVLVDLSRDPTGQSVLLQSFNEPQGPAPFPGSERETSGPQGSMLNAKTFELLKINIKEPTAAAVRSVPTALVPPALWTEADATQTQSLRITDEGAPGSMQFSFDGVPFDMDLINKTIDVDTTQKWTVTNGSMPHSFHIHDVQFAITSRSNTPIAPYERGWKDTVFLPANESVTFVARFEDYRDDKYPYMYHCHMANHEDGGLMGQFVVR